MWGRGFCAIHSLSAGETTPATDATFSRSFSSFLCHRNHVPRYWLARRCFLFTSFANPHRRGRAALQLSSCTTSPPCIICHCGNNWCIRTGANIHTTRVSTKTDINYHVTQNLSLMSIFVFATPFALSSSYVVVTSKSSSCQCHLVGCPLVRCSTKLAQNPRQGWQ